MVWRLAVDDAIGGTIDLPTNPFGWTQAESRIGRGGEATENLLAADLGIGAQEFAALAREGAFGPKVEA